MQLQIAVIDYDVRRGPDGCTDLYRPAAIGALDEGMLPINIRGIPVPAYDQSASHYYFGTVLRLSDDSPSANGTDVASFPPVGTLLSSTAEECSSNPAGSGTNYGSASPTCSTTPSSPMRGMGKSSDSSTPFGDVALGHLLGRGSFGNVYLGWWENQTVAVKVCMWGVWEKDTFAILAVCTLPL